ncbi:MAG: CdaR family protein [Candidatus Xenobia bacterium]
MRLAFLRENLSLKLFSLAIAIFLWAWVLYTQQDQFTKGPEQSELHLQTDLKVLNVGPDLMVLDAPKSVMVTVRGSTDFINSMRPDAISASVDVRDKPAGEYALAVNVDHPNELKPVRIEPERVSILLDASVTRQFALDPQPHGQPASGFTMGAPILQPSAIKVQGPSRFVDRVAHVIVPIDVNNLETDLVERVEAEPRDDRGLLVQDVTLEPRYVVMTVPIRADVTTRTVPVAPSLVGDLPGSEELTYVGADPPMVTISMPREAPHPVMYLRTEPIPIGKLKHSTTVVTRIIVPEGTTLLHDNDVRVTLKVQKRKHN